MSWLPHRRHRISLPLPSPFGVRSLPPLGFPWVVGHTQQDFLCDCLWKSRVLSIAVHRTVRIYSTEERRLHTTCLETAKKAMESFGLFE